MDQVKIIANVTGDYSLRYCSSSRRYICDPLLMIETALLVGYTFKNELDGHTLSEKECEVFCNENVKSKRVFCLYGESRDTSVRFRVVFALNSKADDLLTVMLSSVLGEEVRQSLPTTPLDVGTYLPSLLLLIEDFEIASLNGCILS